MPLWAGIDEAGYGPALGPLVVAGSAFVTREPPREGVLWELLREGVAKAPRGSAGRLIVNDSKVVYSGPSGLRRLEEGVLGFLHAGAASAVSRVADLLATLTGGRGQAQAEPNAWFRDAPALDLPLATNASALLSKSALLREALDQSGVRPLALRAAVVLPPEFNRMVARTRNKAAVLFQKCGLLLQELWRHAGPGESRVLVDRHGGRARYRKLLLDVFPRGQCDVLEEGPGRSSYRITDGADPTRTLIVTFQEDGDARALPTALASMTAKYVRELYMTAFNAYWRERLDGLRPTAGYRGDARRFLRDIAPVLRAERVDRAALVRVR